MLGTLETLEQEGHIKYRKKIEIQPRSVEKMQIKHRRY